MLEDFSIEQKTVYKMLINAIKNNKCSHAYLIETNGYSKSFDLAKAFAKYLLCPNHYSDNKKCNNCNQCENIDKNEFIELKIIEPDGQWIKKSQLEELQTDFSKKSIIGTKKIYIIKNAEKLNPSSSNSLLKFLEEPESGIYAILLTDNIYQLLDTIISRCQILTLSKNKIENINTIDKISLFLNNNNEDVKKYIEEEQNKNSIPKIIEFIKYYEKNHLETLIYIKKLWNDFFNERKELLSAFSIMLLFYKDCLNYKINSELEIFNDYNDEIKFVSDKNSEKNLISKIGIIMNLKEKIIYNANSNSIMDKLIIQFDWSEN